MWSCRYDTRSHFLQILSERRYRCSYYRIAHLLAPSVPGDLLLSQRSEVGKVNVSSLLEIKMQAAMSRQHFQCWQLVLSYRHQFSRIQINSCWHKTVNENLIDIASPVRICPEAMGICQHRERSEHTQVPSQFATSGRLDWRKEAQFFLCLGPTNQSGGNWRV